MKSLMFALTGGTLLTLMSTAPVSASPTANDPQAGQELVAARSAAQQDDISGWVDFDVNGSLEFNFSDDCDEDCE
nr:hypothetical protein B0A51_14177 [Rachicladosporium sp. CCFEE 5018]